MIEKCTVIFFFSPNKCLLLDQSGPQIQSGILGEDKVWKGSIASDLRRWKAHIYWGFFWPCPSINRELICPSPFPARIWWFLLLWPKIKGAAFLFLPVPSIMPPSPWTCQPQSEAQLHHLCGPALITAPPCFPAQWPKVAGSTNTPTKRLYWLTLNGSKRWEFCFQGHLLCPLCQGDPFGEANLGGNFN